MVIVAVMRAADRLQRYATEHLVEGGIDEIDAAARRTGAGVGIVTTAVIVTCCLEVELLGSTASEVTVGALLTTCGKVAEEEVREAPLAQERRREVVRSRRHVAEASP